MIIQLDEALVRLRGELSDNAQELGRTLNIEKLRQDAAETEALTTAPDFWSNQETSGKTLQKLKQLQNKIAQYEDLLQSIDDAITLGQMAQEEHDEETGNEVLAETQRIADLEDRMRLETLLSGEYDHNNAILSLHPGAGGTEAQDWAQMLYRMYTRWGEKHGYDVKLMDWLDGDEAGIKSATVMITGENAYGYLKGENGVHRLVRVSPFDASGRRHTSFASVEVLPEMDDNVNVEIREEDIEVTAHKSSGAGGQHINKTSSAIRIVHKPTGIVVGCQTERSQLQNKETALKMLKAKLLEIKEREHLDKIEDIKGEKVNIEWGSQIRSYVFMPYTLAKDMRTGYEDANINAVMDGEIDGFINAYLQMEHEKIIAQKHV